MIDSRCGLHCTGCAWKESHGCCGCIETMGHPFHGECHIAACCQNQGFIHCGECPEIPCADLYAYAYLDPEHGDVPQGARVDTCRRWAAESGRQAYEHVLLTSAGFEDMDGKQRPNLVARFHAMLGIPADKARVLFVPTAAQDAEDGEMAAWCRRELIGVGILDENITDYDLDGSMTEPEAMRHDAIYFTGGDTAYLLRRLRETGFDRIVKRMVYANKVYIGVSAGSLIATPSIGGPYDADAMGLALVNAYLSVHCPDGANPRADLPLPHIPLTDAQALAVSWSGYTLIEG